LDAVNLVTALRQVSREPHLASRPSLQDPRLGGLLAALGTRLQRDRDVFEARHLASLSTAAAWILSALPAKRHNALLEPGRALLAQAVQAGLDLGPALGAREASSMVWALAKSGETNLDLMMQLGDAMRAINTRDVTSLSVFASGWGTHLALARQQHPRGGVGAALQADEVGIAVLEGLTTQLFEHITARAQGGEDAELAPRVVVNVVRTIRPAFPLLVPSCSLRSGWLCKGVYV